MEDVYNKELCVERQVNHERGRAVIQEQVDKNTGEIRALREAILLLTKLAESEKLYKVLMTSLCAVIVVLAFGKEIAVAVMARLIP